MSRTTRAQLESLVEIINKQLDRPTKPYADSVEHPWGAMKAQIGNFHIDNAYGGYRLCEMDNEHGGVRDISPRLPAGQFADWLRAFIAGIRYGSTELATKE